MKKRLLLIIVFFVFLVPLAPAETIILKTGDKVEGELIEKTGRFIKIEFAGVPLTYYLDEIDSINGKRIEVIAENESGINFKDTNVAIAYWKDKIKRDPKDFGACNNLGLIYVSLGQYQDAIIYFEKAVGINPKFSEGFLGLGVCYNSLNHSEQAVIYFQRALEINPDSAKANNNLGHVYIDLGQFDKALPYCQKAVKINPDYADAYSNLGFIYVSMQQFELGIKNLKKAVAKNPKDATSFENLGYVFFILGNNNQARGNFQKAKDLYAEKPDSEGTQRVEEFLKKLP